MPPTIVDLPQSLTLGNLPAVVRAWPIGPVAVRARLHPEQWVHPAGIVGLACLIERTRRAGGTVRVQFAGCPRAGYWQRMGFFAVLGLPAPPPPGIARPARGRFSELRRVAGIDDVDEITQDLVEVADPDRASWQVYSHIVSEALNNVCQHSEAEGFCAAQFYPQMREVRFCIGDFGCGLRQALRAFTPKNDYAAVLKALEVGVTGRQVRVGQPEMRNRGVGLSAIHRLVEDNGGSLTVWSGTGIFRTAPMIGGDLMPHWPGTLIAARMQRNTLLRAFRDIMETLDAQLKASGRAQRPRLRRPP